MLLLVPKCYEVTGMVAPISGRYGCAIMTSYTEINKAVSQWLLTFNLCVSVTWPLTCAFHIHCTHTLKSLTCTGVCVILINLMHHDVRKFYSVVWFITTWMNVMIWCDSFSFSLYNGVIGISIYMLQYLKSYKWYIYPSYWHPVMKKDVHESHLVCLWTSCWPQETANSCTYAFLIFYEKTFHDDVISANTSSEKLPPNFEFTKDSHTLL